MLDREIMRSLALITSPPLMIRSKLSFAMAIKSKEPLWSPECDYLRTSIFFLEFRVQNWNRQSLKKAFPPPSLALLNFQCKYPTIDLLPNVLSDTPPFNVKLLLQLSAIQQKNWTTILLTLFFFWVVQDSSIGDLVSEWVRQSVSQTFDFSITMTNND